MTTLGTVDAALLSEVLLWRISKAAPTDREARDVDTRLRQAGTAFRLGTRPLSADELASAITRLRAAS